MSPEKTETHAWSHTHRAQDTCFSGTRESSDLSIRLNGLARNESGSGECGGKNVIEFHIEGLSFGSREQVSIGSRSQIP